jgi:hypothetical protein
VANRLCQLDQLSRWLERQALTAGELSEARAVEFASSRRAAGLVTWTSRPSVALPLGYLREISVVPVPAPVALGKGRKRRATTLTAETVKVMRAWLTERHGQPDEPLFPTRQGRPLSR